MAQWVLVWSQIWNDITCSKVAVLELRRCKILASACLGKEPDDFAKPVSIHGHMHPSKAQKKTSFDGIRLNDQDRPRRRIGIVIWLAFEGREYVTVEEAGRGIRGVNLTIRRKFIADVLEYDNGTIRMGVRLNPVGSGIVTFAAFWGSFTNNLTCEPWESGRKRMASVGEVLHNLRAIYTAWQRKTWHHEGIRPQEWQLTERAKLFLHVTICLEG